MIIIPVISRFVEKWFNLETKARRALILRGAAHNPLVDPPLALALSNEVSRHLLNLCVSLFNYFCVTERFGCKKIITDNSSAFLIV